MFSRAEALDFRRTIMLTLARRAVLGAGLLTSGTALAADYYGATSPYNQQYSPYYGSYAAYPYPYSYPYYGYTYPAYTYGYGYPAYGWYAGVPYAWSSWTPRDPWAPYSKANANWVPYVGWR